jgi:2',3'-cyclic-nucleotide 2'-phosphodiesterase (5'-nucleotidase family)
MHYRRWAIEKYAPRAEIAALIAPYQKKLKKQMDTPLAISPIPLERRHPESRLGNLVAEICLARLRSLGWKPDLFITNLGGIRKDLGAGGILIRDVFELLPFENQLILVSLRGDELEKLLDIFAEKRGEPIAGARLVIDVEGKKASSILIQGEPLVRTREYLLGTSDYLVMTGWMSSLLSGKETNSTDLSLRDAMIWGLVERGMRWSYHVDGRVRLVSAAPTSQRGKDFRKKVNGAGVTSRPTSIKGKREKTR